MQHSYGRYTPLTRANITGMAQWSGLDPDLKETIRILSLVFPFRTNPYVVNELIDWDNVPDDPVYQLTFPQKGMLNDAAFKELQSSADKPAMLARLVQSLRLDMNPHPAGQLTHNIPLFRGTAMEGVQHKYEETVLFFPSPAQTCHAYCTFCFRWPQFVGMDEMRFGARSSHQLVEYLAAHPKVTDVLFTGGDPFIMSARSLREFIMPLLDERLDHIHSIRIGTKALSYWPQRFLTDRDADDVLRLLEELRRAGKNVAIMGHFNCSREMETDLFDAAMRRLLATGASIRMQAPLLRHINDSSVEWTRLWRKGVQSGAIPYYMFLERDTGPKEYFRVPLAEAYGIFRDAYAGVSGLARTVRGPCMSVLPGKIHIDGITTINGQKVFALQFLQARRPEIVRRPFYAKYDDKAFWWDDLKPAFGSRFEFEVWSAGNVLEAAE